jgi:hypothetical protein
VEAEENNSLQAGDRLFNGNLHPGNDPTVLAPRAVPPEQVIYEDKWIC